jgi:hypothetical protein
VIDIIDDKVDSFWSLEVAQFAKLIYNLEEAQQAFDYRIIFDEYMSSDVFKYLPKGEAFKIDKSPSLPIFIELLKETKVHEKDSAENILRFHTTLLSISEYGFSFISRLFEKN